MLESLALRKSPRTDCGYSQINKYNIHLRRESESTVDDVEIAIPMQLERLENIQF